MPRPRSDWKDFPPAYFDILNKFLDGAEELTIPVKDERRGLSLRQSLYRFFVRLKQQRKDFFGVLTETREIYEVRQYAEVTVQLTMPKLIKDLDRWFLRIELRELHAPITRRPWISEDERAQNHRRVQQLLGDEQNHRDRVAYMGVEDLNDYDGKVKPSPTESPQQPPPRKLTLQHQVLMHQAGITDEAKYWKQYDELKGKSVP